MMLGVVLALMAAIAVFAVLWPLSRRGRDEAAASDVAIYRDQLAEIERDRKAAMIAPAEADAARVEVSRRLLAAADAHGETASATPVTGDIRRRRAAAVAALVLIPILAGVLYLHFGSPDLPGQPLASRLAEPQDHSLASLVARVEAHLAQNPDDGRGWEVIAPVYLRLNRIEDAVRADRNVLRLLGPSAARHAELAEVLVLQASGVVTAEAKSEFDEAIRLDSNDARAQFYLGLAAEQDGRGSDAAEIWRTLIARAPADAPWVDSVREALARVEPQSSSSSPGPSKEEMLAAGEMPQADREQMVRGMVERLAARLAENGSDVDGWVRLMRAYVVLGERDKARNAAEDARRAFKDMPDLRRRIDDTAKAIGIDG
jgi:cytochrome c-type biogenesis protein CcmH